MIAAFDLPHELTEGLTESQRQRVRKGLQEVRRDPVANARTLHGWDPFEGQQRLLRALDVREGKVKLGAVCAGRGYGKTKLIAEVHLEVAEAIPGAKCLAACRTQDQSQIAFKAMLAMLNANVLARSIIEKVTLSPFPVIRLKNGSTITFRTTDDEGVSLRGMEFDFVTLDEAAFAPESVWHFLLTLVRKSNGPVIAFSTPNEDWFEDLFHRLEDQRSNGDDTVVAFHAPAQDNPHLSPEYFERMREQLPEIFYQREIEARFVGGDVHTFRREHLERIFDAALPPSVPPVASHRYGQGWDLAIDRAATCGYVFDCTSRNLVIGVHAEKHERTEWPHVQRRVEENTRAYPGRKAIDWTGVGKAAGQNLRVHVRDEEKFVFNGPSRYELCIEGMKFVEDHATRTDGLVSLLLPTTGPWAGARTQMRRHKLSLARRKDSKSMGDKATTWDELDAILLAIHAVNLSIRHRGSLVEAA